MTETAIEERRPDVVDFADMPVRSLRAMRISGEWSVSLTMSDDTRRHGMAVTFADAVAKALGLP
jgi:hypothetical protein